jgi:NADP-dependent 3-hydroxy acid dehydrogenase YdfG
MSKTIAIFGAGPGFGLSVARRFGRDDFRVALVARTPDRLDALVTDLAADGIESAGFVADLGDREQVREAITAITSRFDRIDVVEYSPGGMNFGGHAVPALDVDLESLEFPLDLSLRTPVALIRQTLPAMIERGDGALLVTQAISAIRPMPFAANFGLAGAAMRNYVYSLNGALADKGVYAGTLTVAALIERSEIAQYFDSTPASQTGVAPDAVDRVDPDDLAETYWDMYIKRDRVEEVVGSFGQ